EMVVVPSGTFTMGSPDSEAGRGSDEGPQRTVQIGYSFAVGKTEVTWAEWEACVADGGCSNSGPDSRGGDEGWGKGSRPVINVSWEDAQAYADWLSRKTGERYRLLSEAEWEYVARAGTNTPFYFGNTITPDQANYAGIYTYNGGPKGTYHQKTVPVGTYPRNAFGVHDMHGNVWEWTQDCYVDSYSGAPTDGSPRLVSDCSRRVLRGGSWGYLPQGLRSAHRFGPDPTVRNSGGGFRVARTL
ncbi:MAG: formylglycine-generating enzyme family protein, partial [Pseudomonadota bacterium]